MCYRNKVLFNQFSMQNVSTLNDSYRRILPIRRLESSQLRWQWLAVSQLPHLGHHTTLYCLGVLHSGWWFGLLRLLALTTCWLSWLWRWRLSDICRRTRRYKFRMHWPHFIPQFDDFSIREYFQFSDNGRKHRIHRNFTILRTLHE